MQIEGTFLDGESELTLTGTMTIYNNKATSSTIDDVIPLTMVEDQMLGICPPSQFLIDVAGGGTLITTQVLRAKSEDDDVLIAQYYVVGDVDIGNVIIPSSAFNITLEFISEV